MERDAHDDGAEPEPTVVGPAAAVRVAIRAHRFGRAEPVLRDLDLAIEPGAFVAIVGPSGSGKTTLLRLLAGLARPSDGEIEIDRRPPGMRSTAMHAIGFCFQDPRLLPWRSAIENVVLPLEIGGVDRATARERALGALHRVGLADRADAMPHELSGGMRMRVGLARALVHRPRLLLLDEPLGALDEVTRMRLHDELHRLWREDGTTTILVTHSISEAAYLATRVVVLGTQPGRVVHDEPVTFAERDAALRTGVPFNELVARLQQALLAGSTAGVPA